MALLTKPAAAQAPLYSAVAVSGPGTGNSIGQANTSRNVAVDNAGAIYVVFLGSTGIRGAKSTRTAASTPKVPSACTRND